MNSKQAASIIKRHVELRDSEASEDGLDSAAYQLRRVGDLVSASDEDLADDILRGRGTGSEANARRIIRIAKKVEAVNV